MNMGSRRKKDSQKVPTPERLLFLSETANVELSLDRLNIERQAAGRLLFSSPEETDWVVYVSGEDILKNYFFTRRNRLRLLARELRRQREGQRTVKLAGIFLAAFSKCCCRGLAAERLDDQFPGAESSRFLGDRTGQFGLRGDPRIHQTGR